MGVESIARAVAGLLRRPLKTSYERPMIVPETWAKRILLVALVVAVGVFPFFSDYYKMAIAVAIAIGVIGAVGTNLISGTGGQAQIGMAALMAMGAFTSAELVMFTPLPPLVCILLSGASAGVLGALVAIPAMRVRGIYLIIATLAMHYIVLYTFTRVQGAQVGDSGYPMTVVQIGGLSQIQSWYFIIVASAFIAVIAMRNLLRTRYGRSWQTLSLDEVGASVLGVNIRRQKVTVFTFTSIIFGLLGGLFAYYVRVVNIDPFTFDLSVSFIAMMVIGGIGSAPGSVFGAIFVQGLPYALTGLFELLPAEVARSLTSRLFVIEATVYGLAIVLFLVYERRGLNYAWQRFARLVESWPLPLQQRSDTDG